MSDDPERRGCFYPSIIPPHEDHPRGTAFEIVAAGDGRGRGLMALSSFAADDRLAQLSGILVPHPSLNTLQLAPGLHMSDPWFCRFLLHSCDPNAYVEKANMTLIARRDIAPGDLLSIDYGATEDRLGRQFECSCGAENCRRWIAGRTEQLTEEGKRVLAARRH